MGSANSPSAHAALDVPAEVEATSGTRVAAFSELMSVPSRSSGRQPALTPEPIATGMIVCGEPTICSDVRCGGAWRERSVRVVANLHERLVCALMTRDGQQDRVGHRGVHATAGHESRWRLE